MRTQRQVKKQILEQQFLWQRVGLGGVGRGLQVLFTSKKAALLLNCTYGAHLQLINTPLTKQQICCFPPLSAHDTIPFEHTKHSSSDPAQHRNGLVLQAKIPDKFRSAWPNPIGILYACQKYPVSSANFNTADNFSRLYKMHKYRLLEKIGQGSFGTVIRAVNQRGQVVAIKQILNCNPFDRDRLLEEVKIMSAFNHPNLVKVQQSFYDQEHSAMYIVMEFCDTDLLKFYKRKHADLTQVDILFIFKEIVSAFTAMNDYGVIHRDLKPENILVNKEGHVKIADFGCAKKLDSETLQRIIMSFDKGTATYASPEILRALPYSSKCDVWSAGCVLYVLVTGKHPFLQSSVSKTIKVIQQKTRNKQIVIPHQGKIDSALRYAIKRCLMYNQIDRCSWRQFALCRLFSPKIHRVKSYLDYLKNMSNIANWLCQTFWKQRKQYNVSDCKDEIFTYFIIKYESSVLELGQKIIERDMMYSYLFQQEAWDKNDVDKGYKEEFMKYLVKTRQYLISVRNAINSPQALLAINQTYAQGLHCFTDLEHSIIAAQKILNGLNGNPNAKVINVMMKWVNFEKWFDFSMKPTLEKVLMDKQDSVLTTFTSVASLNNYH